MPTETITIGAATIELDHEAGEGTVSVLYPENTGPVAWTDHLTLGRVAQLSPEMEAVEADAREAGKRLAESGWEMVDPDEIENDSDEQGRHVTQWFKLAND